MSNEKRIVKLIDTLRLFATETDCEESGLPEWKLKNWYQVAKHETTTCLISMVISMFLYLLFAYAYGLRGVTLSRAWYSYSLYISTLILVRLIVDRQ